MFLINNRRKIKTVPLYKVIKRFSKNTVWGGIKEVFSKNTPFVKSVALPSTPSTLVSSQPVVDSPKLPFLLLPLSNPSSNSFEDKLPSLSSSKSNILPVTFSEETKTETETGYSKDFIALASKMPEMAPHIKHVLENNLSDEELDLYVREIFLGPIPKYPEKPQLIPTPLTDTQLVIIKGCSTSIKNALDVQLKAHYHICEILNENTTLIIIRGIHFTSSSKIVFVDKNGNKTTVNTQKISDTSLFPSSQTKPQNATITAEIRSMAKPVQDVTTHVLKNSDPDTLSAGTYLALDALHNLGGQGNPESCKENVLNALATEEKAIKINERSLEDYETILNHIDYARESYMEKKSPEMTVTFGALNACRISNRATFGYSVNCKDDVEQDLEPEMEHVLILTAKPDQNQNGNGNKEEKEGEGGDVD